MPLVGSRASSLFEAVSIAWIDRPLALCLHEAAGAVQPFFGAVARLGLGYPYLVLFAALLR